MATTSGQLFLGIDVGTSGTKALLLDEAGEVVASSTHEYPLSTPRPMWSEQDPEDWWRASCASIRICLEQSGAAPQSISCVGMTGQMHGLVMLDARGDVLRPAILWNDQRTAAECKLIHDRIGPDRVIQITGKPVLTGFTAPKILWVRQNEPGTYERCASVLLPKDYVRFRLTGERVSDVADASGTSLFDVPNRRWSDELIEAMGINCAWLPRVVESPDICAEVSNRAATECGLVAGTPVVGGAGDQAAEAIGCGVVNDGDISVTIGTSGVVFVAHDAPRIDAIGRLHAYCHAIREAWHVMGVMLSAGGSLRWYRDTLCQDEVRRAAQARKDPYDLMLRNAANAPAGCEGLQFLPYLAGERTPHPDPTARGGFIGLTLRHTKAHMTRAVLEGVTFGLRDSLELARDLGAHVSRVRTSGGGARSAFWRQVMADVFNADVTTVNVSQGAAYGAAVLAAVGAGTFSSVRDAARSFIKETGTTTPGENVGAYQTAFERFRSLYPILAPEFRAIN